jgi:hypothetical protein
MFARIPHLVPGICASPAAPSLRLEMAHILGHRHVPEAFVDRCSRWTTHARQPTTPDTRGNARIGLALIVPSLSDALDMPAAQPKMRRIKQPAR